MPGSRLPTSVAAGVLRTNALLFLLYFAIAALPWTPLIVLASSELGSAALPLLKRTQWGLAGVLLALIVLFLLVRTVGVPLLTWRGRRRLLGRLRRLRRWEFWPPWVFYPPVLAYVAWLGLRHRSATLFAAVNPAIPAGGFVGESKSAILAALPADRVPAWTTVSAGSAEELNEAITRFCAERGLELPVVLKPDVGQRSRGVAIVRSSEDVQRYFESYEPVNRPLIVQRFVAGVEYGIFWARGPDDEQGTILSITEKIKPELTGDGRRTLEELILADERAVAISATYLAENPLAPEIVPAAGERVPLVEVGAHARGAIFLDARHLRSPALERAIGEIVSAYEGFDFGRFDVVVPSPEALTAGRDLQVLEVNGVTSEATHIYDPRHSVFAAYRTLFAQWRRAFEIGAQRRARGHRPPPLRRLVGMTLEFWSGP